MEATTFCTTTTVVTIPACGHFLFYLFVVGRKAFYHFQATTIVRSRWSVEVFPGASGGRAPGRWGGLYWGEGGAEPGRWASCLVS